MEDKALQILNDYPADRYNVLAPQTVTQMTPWHQITVSTVTLSHKPDDGDVYPQSGKLALSKIGLLKLADAAGIRWGKTELERFEDGSFSAYVTAEKQDPDGTWRKYPGSYYWDVTQRLADIAAPSTSRGQSESRMIRTFSAQRAETGAMSRAIRAIVGIKATYTVNDLRKPFVVARVSFNPFNDPMIRDAYRHALLIKLTDNVALMRGDFNRDDPLGIDGPHESTRPTPEQLAAANDTLALMDGRGVDQDTGEIFDAQTTTATPAPEWDNADDEQPEQDQGGGDPDAPAITSPKELLAAVNAETMGHYNSLPHLLNAAKQVLGADWKWPTADDAGGYAEALAVLVDHANAGK